MYFSAAASSENDQGSINLASNTACVPSTIPSRVAAIQGIAECLTRRCTSRTCRLVLRWYQERLSSSVALHNQVAGQVLGLGFAPFLAPQLNQGGLVAAH